MSDELKFQPGPDGTVPFKPLIGFRVEPIGGILVGSLLRFVDQPDDIDKPMQFHQVHILLTPQQALHLSEALGTAALKILTPETGPKQ